MKTTIVILALLVSLHVTARENPSGKNSAPLNQVTISNCNPPTASMDLHINNVRARVLAGADMWWDLTNAQYEVPDSSGKHSIFAGSLWIGGLDGGGQILTAAQTYRQTGVDFWPGAIDTSLADITPARCTAYDRHWKLNRQEVLDFISNGTTTPDIISWPGNGSSVDNESHYLAPFVDVNADGLYNHLDGDYPGYNTGQTYPNFPGTPVANCNNYLFGDQNIWWVINDVGNVHTETNSLPIKLEIRCQAFAYQSALPSLDNSTFYKYEIINRSSTTLLQTYFGQWVDPDLGTATDDFVGCDVLRGFGYCYNGDANDDLPAGYGIDPPAIGVDFLQGPYADIGDNIDNDFDGCLDCTYIDSAGVTLIFSDSILPEGIAMAKFVYFNNINASPVGNPVGFTDFYSYLQGVWLDGQPITYGGDGRSPGNPVCNYMFPGTTDPLYTVNWTELTAGNIPDDRRFIQSAGPFSLEPGEVNYVTTGVVWARQIGGGQLGSITLLQQYDDDVQQLFDQCFNPTGVGIPENPDSEMIHVYPNPANDYVVFQTNGISSLLEVKVFNTSGQIVFSKTLSGTGSLKWDASRSAAGTYFYEIISDKKSQSSGKLVIY